MRFTKKFTHYWFVIVSILSFLAGWGMLAHSLKPTSNQITSTTSNTTNATTITLPTLQPIVTFGSGNTNTTSSSLNILTPSTQSNAGFPALRTGGS